MYTSAFRWAPAPGRLRPAMSPALRPPRSRPSTRSWPPRMQNSWLWPNAFRPWSSSSRAKTGARDDGPRSAGTAHRVAPPHHMDRRCQPGAVGCQRRRAGLLPAGLSLSGTGDLTGTPTSSAPYSFTITVSDALGRELDLLGAGTVT